jgi:hypothetical protein
MRRPCCVSVVPPLITYEPVGRAHEIQQGRRAVGGDLRSVDFNPVASIITEWRTFRLLRWLLNLHQPPQNHEISYSDWSLEDEQLLVRQFFLMTKNTKVESGRKLKFTFCFMETTLELLQLDR